MDKVPETRPFPPGGCPPRPMSWVSLFGKLILSVMRAVGILELFIYIYVGFVSQ